MSKLMHNFRKHQKTVLAVTGVFIIFSFTVGPYILDAVSTGGGGPAPKNDTVVTYKNGRISEQDMALMVQAHNSAVRGCQSVAMAGMQKGQRSYGFMVYPEYGMFGLPPAVDEETVLQIRLLGDKARQLGLSVDDAAVTQFLRRLYGVPSSSSAHDAALGQALKEGLGDRLSEVQFYDQMKIELLAQNMRYLSRTVLTASDPRTFEVVPPPSEAYAYFERLNKSVEIESYGVKVEDYLAQVKDEPTDAQLRELFEKHKNDFANPYLAEPGFKVPPKVAVQYVMADFNKLLEEEKAKITDEQINEEYDRGVAAGQYTVPDLPEEEPAKDPEDKPADDKKSGEEKPEETKPEETKPEEPAVDAPKPEDKKAEEPKADAPKAEEPKAEEPKAEEPKAEEPKAEEPKVDDAKAEEPKAEGSEGQDEVAPPAVESADEKTSADDKPAAEEKPAAEPAGEEKKSEEEKPSTEKPAEEKPAAETPADEKKGDEEKPAAEKPAAEDAPKSPAEPKTKVQPLEKVKDQIRDSLARRPAQQRLTEKFTAVEDAVRKFQRETATKRRKAMEAKDEKEKAELIKAIPEFDVAAMAKMQGLEAKIIPPTGYFEMSEYAIGKASRFTGQQILGFADIVFQQNNQLYDPQTVRAFATGAEFLYWVTEEQKEYVPEFEQAREDVIKAWKKIQAREIAEKEAQKLVDSVKKDQTLKDVFGDKAMVSGQFTWLRGPNMPFGMGGRPTMSEVLGVEQAGEEFMKSVFSLKVGEVGIAPNQSKSIYYIVRVTSRSPGDDNLREQFVGSRMGYQSTGMVAQLQRSELERQWYSDLEKEFSVKWQRDPRQMDRDG